jgi:uncharacterized membrane-anchored protein YhcB (DUF1043 family)
MNPIILGTFTNIKIRYHRKISKIYGGQTLLTSNLVIYLSLMVVGAIAGYFASRAFKPIQKEQKDIQNKLIEAQRELKDYQQEVANHFRATSKAVSSLSKNYKCVVEQLASGALHLVNTDVSRQILNPVFDKSEDINLESSADVQPPKDYAPKVPGGVLSEEYGLKEAVKPVSNPATSDSAYMAENDDDPTLNIN